MNELPQFDATLICDASFCSKTGAAGYGWYIACDKAKVGGGDELNDPATSVIAEMQAVVNVLYLARYHFRYVGPGSMVNVQTDCQDAINQLTGYKELRYPDSIAIKKEYDKLINLMFVKLLYVPAHTGRDDKRYIAQANCDQLARQYMRESRRRKGYH